jgi:hypothetical protein
MLNWILSLVSAIVLLTLAYALESNVGTLSAWFYAAALILWLLLGYLLHAESEFADDVTRAEAGPPPPPTELLRCESEATKTNDEAVHQLVKELTQKEEQIKALQVKLSEREFRRSLSRIASISETLYFTLKIRAEGKITDDNAIEQLRMEIESAIGDLGLEFDAIIPGQTVAELTAGSFVVVRAEEAPSGVKPGTVKEVLNVGLYAKDETGKKHFISPSKLNVYKL